MSPPLPDVAPVPGPPATTSTSVRSELNKAIIRLLSTEVNFKEKVVLALPAHLILLFGLLLLGSVISFRLGGRQLEFAEFLAILVTGCVLVAIGALLYICQFVVEQETLRVVSRGGGAKRDAP